jgi:hypothetical protein
LLKRRRRQQRSRTTTERSCSSTTRCLSCRLFSRALSRAALCAFPLRYLLRRLVACSLTMLRQILLSLRSQRQSASRLRLYHPVGQRLKRPPRRGKRRRLQLLPHLPLRPKHRLASLPSSRRCNNNLTRSFPRPPPALAVRSSLRIAHVPRRCTVNSHRPKHELTAVRVCLLRSLLRRVRSLEGLSCLPLPCCCRPPERSAGTHAAPSQRTRRKTTRSHRNAEGTNRQPIILRSSSSVRVLLCRLPVCAAPLLCPFPVRRTHRDTQTERQRVCPQRVRLRVPAESTCRPLRRVAAVGRRVPLPLSVAT